MILNFSHSVAGFLRKKGYVHIARGDEALPAAATYKPVGYPARYSIAGEADGLTIMDELKKEYGYTSHTIHVSSGLK